MVKLEIKGINYELLEELDLSLKRGVDVLNNASSQSNKVITNVNVKEYINGTINSWIEATKREVNLTPTIRELDIQELKKLDAVLYRDGKYQTPSSIKASDLSAKAINLYAAMVSRVYTNTVRICEEVYSGEQLESLTQGYKDFAEGIFKSNENKSKRFDVARKAMALLRSSATEKSIETATTLKK